MERKLHLTFSSAVRPSSINGWLYTFFFLNEFNVSKAVVSDLYRERGDTNFILGSVTSVSRRKSMRFTASRLSSSRWKDNHVTTLTHCSWKHIFDGLVRLGPRQLTVSNIGLSWHKCFPWLLSDYYVILRLCIHVELQKHWYYLDS